MSLRRPSLTQLILLGLVAGALYGHFDPAHASQLGWIRDIFLHLIKSIIAPLVFSTVVVGIAGGGDLMQVGRMGWKSLLYFEVVTTLALFIGLLVGSLYLALVLFVVVVFGAVAAIVRLPMRAFLAAVREPFTLAFVTTSSESALPKAMEAMEAIGVPRRIVAFVMPAGYSFNLDGTTLYLSMASVFIAQACASTVPGFHFTLPQQIAMMLTLMVTSKGVAAVPRASLVILIATVNAFLPVPYGAIGVAMIFGIDELMDMARTSVNLLGNCLATVVVARWEGEFDDAKARAYRS